MLNINIKKLKVKNKVLFEDVKFSVEPKNITILMGPNGVGKSSLIKAIMCHPEYKIEGDVVFRGENINDLKTYEIVEKGIAVVFQNPPEVEIKLKTLIAHFNYSKDRLRSIMDVLDIPDAWLERELIGFSGGERKKVEFLLAYIKDPEIYLIDEIDSGLDINSMKIISTAIADEVKNGKGFLIITHHGKLIDELRTQLSDDFFNVVVISQDVKKGGIDLLKEIERKGY